MERVGVTSALRELSAPAGRRCSVPRLIHALRNVRPAQTFLPETRSFRVKAFWYRLEGFNYNYICGVVVLPEAGSHESFEGESGP